MKKKSIRGLEVFKNSHPDREYEIKMECPEFTCLCPKTGQPDFAELEIRYVPDKLCIELKSLKLYLWSFRNEGTFHEKVINDILDDLVQISTPRWIEVIGAFNVRGGIHTTVRANYEAPKKKPKTKNKK
jgi:7-cyano-7-deazaguanine reductase